MKNTKLLLLLTVVLILNSACRQKIDEIYLIPRGFTGNFAVVFDVERCEKDVLENGTRVYRIPDDGILITQASYNKTLHDEKYFFVDGDERVPIPGTFFADAEELRRMRLSDDDLFVRFSGAKGGNGGPGYSLHYVGNHKGIDKSTNDFSGSEPTGLDVRVASKLKKLAAE